MNSPSRGVSQWMPMPGVVCTLSSPFGRSLLSVSLARAASSFMNTSCAVWCSSSPCSVRMSPRAWRWNNDTPSSCSSADTCRETADCDRPSCSPAWVKLPASAAAWNTFSLSQSMPFFPFAIERFLFCSMLLLYAVVGEEPLGLQRCHAAQPGGGHRLAIDVVGHVTGGEQARHRGRGRIGRGPDVTVRLHLDLAGDEFGRRRMADGDEHAVGGDLLDCAGLDVLQRDAADLERAFVAEHVVQRRIPDHVDLGMLEQAVLENLLGAERIAPVHHGDLGGEVRQKQRLLDRGVAATDYDDLLALVEKAVAGRASRHAVAFELLLRR